MTEITSGMVKELREKTSAGMLDCKKALAETKGNMEEAIDWLRKKGLSSAAKKAGRIAAEGLVSVYMDDTNTKGGIAEVNCETDFVTKNAEFQEYAGDASIVAMFTQADMDATKAFGCYKANKSFGERLTDLIAKIGENMNIRRVGYLEVEEGVISSYIHNAAIPNAGRIAVLVALESKADKEKLAELGKQIAMHIAAANPLFLNTKAVDPASIEREKAIFTEQAKASGKPDNIIEKMVEGRINKYFDEVVLEEQAFIMDNEKKVKDIVKDAAAKLGTDIKLKEFIVYRLGEGIEKKSDDFAAEVAAQLGK
jgi:elongation factor Ts